MTLLELMMKVEDMNEVKELLGLNKATVQVFVDDEQIGEEFTRWIDLVLAVKNRFGLEWLNDVFPVHTELKKTYNNTLCTCVKGMFKGKDYFHKVEFFVDC